MKIEFTQATFVSGGDFADIGTVRDLPAREAENLVAMGRAKKFIETPAAPVEDRSIGLQEAPEAPEFTTRKGRFAKK
jgi:hypothetical protein